jgi:hypothetical protein
MSKDENIPYIDQLPGISFTPPEPLTICIDKEWLAKFVDARIEKYLNSCTITFYEDCPYSDVCSIKHVDE